MMLIFPLIELLLLAAAAVYYAAIKTHRICLKVIRPFWVLAGGTFLASIVMFLPLHYTAERAYSGALNSCCKAVLASIGDTIGMFSLNGGFDPISDFASSVPNSGLYSFVASALYLAGPMMTLGVVLSFVRNLQAHCSYLLHYDREVHVFSELNEKALTLCASLRQREPKCALVFTDVAGEDERSYELQKDAEQLHAICFRRDVLAVDFRRHSKKRCITFFLLGEDEAENINQALQLMEEYHDREHSRIYLFASGSESEMMLSGCSRGKVILRRVNEKRALILHHLYNSEASLFRNAVPQPDEDAKLIHAVIVGLGGHGTEMLKALPWFCQMEGYRVEIDAFDADPLAASHFSALCPELMSPEYNGVFLPGEAQYTIRIHSGMDVESLEFMQEVLALQSPTYVLVSLGDDIRNIRAAERLRVLLERMGSHAEIQAIVYDTRKKEALTNAANWKGQPYRIECIGDLAESYSADIILDSELERDALSRHLQWGAEEEFWNFEYNYNSSVASAVHARMNALCGLAGAGKRAEDMTEEERTVFETNEHRRWNAYMRAEGYVYSGSKEKSSRNDLGKMHHDLVSYAELSEEERRKDSRVAGKRN